MKRTILVLLLFTILAGCTGIASHNSYKQAQGTVIWNDQAYTMAVGEFEWQEEDFQFRKISNSEMDEQSAEFDTLLVEQGGKLKIIIDQNPSSITLHQLSEDHSRTIVELKDNEMTLPREAGYYSYEVNVVWHHGKATYTFNVSIE
ncbi:hypothetical protein M3197_07270 [Sporosarcina aquimarina]|uniref:hypothetical protein n=1 Tax=Sporosarcina aquimarina TaxID=114975 RepID=UPI002041CB5C|nr:hypothetical protein [Sporosarcina aquimarina]MCM3757289.1 hypothetical protein [Sporosarcina aquimarina]